MELAQGSPRQSCPGHRTETLPGAAPECDAAQPGPRPALARPAPRRGAGAPEAAPEQNGEAGRTDAARRATGGTRGRRRRLDALLPPRGLRACRQPAAWRTSHRHLKPLTREWQPRDDVIRARLLDWKDRALAGQVRDSPLGGAAPPGSGRSRGRREDYSSRRPARRADCERSLRPLPRCSCASATGARSFLRGRFSSQPLPPPAVVHVRSDPAPLGLVRRPVPAAP